jgi:deazaflavin-dependent oxidoreductase (nitroreductase family)
MRKLREVPLPAGFTRFLGRLPIALYRVRLGWLLGRRFLLLEHRGRRSGRRRETVLEVIRHDRERWWVASGWGERTQWLRNLRATPGARIRCGREAVRVEARVLSQAEAEHELVVYGRRHPRAARGVARALGWESDAGEADMRAFASVVRVVELRRAG